MKLEPRDGLLCKSGEQAWIAAAGLVHESTEEAQRACCACMLLPELPCGRLTEFLERLHIDHNDHLNASRLCASRTAHGTGPGPDRLRSMCTVRADSTVWVIGDDSVRSLTDLQNERFQGMKSI